MKKVRLTTSGKVFFCIVILLAILLLFTSLPKKSISIPLNVSIFCSPDCSLQQIPVGYNTLAAGCFTNQTECQLSSQKPQNAENESTILVGFNDSIHKVPGIGTVTMLQLNVTQIYLKSTDQYWIPVLNASKTFDIANLQNETAIVANVNLPTSNYSQEKIIFGAGQIKIDSIFFDIYNQTYNMNPISNETVFGYNFSTSQDATTLLTFDLSVENSVMHTDDGYVLDPHLNISSYNLLPGQQPESSIFIN